MRLGSKYTVSDADVINAIGQLLSTVATQRLHIATDFVEHFLPGSWITSA